MDQEVFNAVKVTDKVYWVGAIDWKIRDFHGYATSRGTTYNAFLILAEKITLVDTVKAPFFDEMISRIASVVDPAKIDVIISNHSEMDHSGCLSKTIDAVKPSQVYASKMGKKALQNHFGIGNAITEVDEGTSLSLGDMTLSFIETRMCHWPDSMFSYLHEDKIMFSQDGFGMHLASSERFSDQLDKHLLDEEAGKYYANILLPLSNFIQKALDKYSAAKLDVQILAPDHGPIYRTPEAIQNIISQYHRWSRQKLAKKAAVIYDTMWESTAKMAEVVADVICNKGIAVKVLPLHSSNRSDVASELLDAAALIVGSPTINNTIFPTVADAMFYIKGLRPKGRAGFTFGSYGWSGEAPKQLMQMLGEIGFETPLEPFRVQYVPTKEELLQTRDFASRIAEKINEMDTDS